jgi:hypothetical protein
LYEPLTLNRIERPRKATFYSVRLSPPRGRQLPPSPQRTPSGRVAWQFIRDLAGELEKPLPL